MTAWICDVHGVLVDSTALVHEAFVATAARYGVPFAEYDYRRVKAVPLVEAYRRLDPAGDPFAKRQYHLHYVRERIADVRAYPGVLETLSLASAAGIRIGAATSYGEIAEACLVNTNLYPLFDCLVTQEDVKRPKPHPDSILLVLRLLAVPDGHGGAGHALFVGDTATDIEAGKAAAVRTVGVSYGVSPEAEIRAARPDHVLDSFQQMRQFLAGAERDGREAHVRGDSIPAEFRPGVV